MIRRAKSTNCLDQSKNNNAIMYKKTKNSDAYYVNLNIYKKRIVFFFLMSHSLFIFFLCYSIKNEEKLIFTVLN